MYSMKQTENDNHLRNVFISIAVVLIISFAFLIWLDKNEIRETTIIDSEIVDLREQIRKEDSLARLEQDSLKNGRKTKDSIYIQTKVKTQIKYVIQKDSLRLLPIDSTIVFLTKRLTNK